MSINKSKPLFFTVYPDNDHLEYEENVRPGASHWSSKKGGFLDALNIDVKTRISNKESCSTCLYLGIAGKVLLGLDIKLQPVLLDKIINDGI